MPDHRHPTEPALVAPMSAARPRRGFPRVSVLCAALPLLAACAAPTAVIPGAGIDPVPCGAAALQPLVGRPVTALDAGSLPGSLRVIRPGDAVTEDFSLTRLNATLDPQDRITALTCG